MTGYNHTRLFAAETAGMEGSTLAVRAISAAENGRWADFHNHKAAAAERFAEALRLLNPADQSNTEERRAA